jgi:hypothetical protein
VILHVLAWAGLWVLPAVHSLGNEAQCAKSEAAPFALTIGSDSTETASIVILEAASVESLLPLVSPEQQGTVSWLADSCLIHGFGNLDASQALQSLPGAFMDTRGAGGSRRLNIRGTALRSPFGVRNTMMMVDGFVLTEADGTTPIEWIEPLWLGELKLISGPAAVTHGGSYGGALELRTARRGEGTWRSGTLGSTGSQQMMRQTGLGLTTGRVELRGVYVNNPGYRTWEWNNKMHGEAHMRWKTQRAFHHGWLGALWMRWALPGALASLQTPLQSPGFDFEAMVDRRRILAGHHLSIPRLETRHPQSIDVWLLLRATQKFNPYGTSAFYQGYKEEGGLGGSLRLRHRWGAWQRGNQSLQLEESALIIADQGQFLEWDQALAGPDGMLRSDVTLSGTRIHVTPSLAYAWGAGWRMEAATAFSHRQRNARGVALGWDYDSPFVQTQLLPKWGISKSIPWSSTAFVHVSTGYSDPTNLESTTFESNGESLVNLQAESAWVVEGGLRGPWGQVAGYHQVVDNPIIQTLDVNDVPSFTHASSTHVMQGVEWILTQQVGKHQVAVSGALQRHRTNQAALPGSSPWMIQCQDRWTLIHRTDGIGTLSWVFRAVGPTPLGFNTDAMHPSYGTLDVQWSWEPQRAPFQVLTGVRNATQTSYSSWNVLDAFGGRHWNPAPPRTYFLSLKLALPDVIALPMSTRY